MHNAYRPCTLCSCTQLSADNELVKIIKMLVLNAHGIHYNNALCKVSVESHMPVIQKLTNELRALNSNGTSWVWSQMQANASAISTVNASG